MAQRTEELMAKGREQALSDDEKAEWAEIMRVEHLVRVAKAKAAIKLKAA
jgi:demethoxyubiquinone hydroxylase (CLK1/Coq7/Cat5 family)